MCIQMTVDTRLGEGFAAKQAFTFRFYFFLHDV
jgi:hypothetical protein